MLPTVAMFLFLPPFSPFLLLLPHPLLTDKRRKRRKSAVHWWRGQLIRDHFMGYGVDRATGRGRAEEEEEGEEDVTWEGEIREREAWMNAEGGREGEPWWDRNGHGTGGSKGRTEGSNSEGRWWGGRGSGSGVTGGGGRHMVGGKVSLPNRCSLWSHIYWLKWHSKLLGFHRDTLRTLVELGENYGHWAKWWTLIKWERERERERECVYVCVCV